VLRKRRFRLTNPTAMSWVDADAQPVRSGAGRSFTKRIPLRPSLLHVPVASSVLETSSSHAAGGGAEDVDANRSRESRERRRHRVGPACTRRAGGRRCGWATSAKRPSCAERESWFGRFGLVPAADDVVRARADRREMTPAWTARQGSHARDQREEGFQRSRLFVESANGHHFPLYCGGRLRLQRAAFR